MSGQSTQAVNGIAETQSQPFRVHQMQRSLTHTSVPTDDRRPPSTSNDRQAVPAYLPSSAQGSWPNGQTYPFGGNTPSSVGMSRNLTDPPARELPSQDVWSGPSSSATLHAAPSQYRYGHGRSTFNAARVPHAYYHHPTSNQTGPLAGQYLIYNQVPSVPHPQSTRYGSPGPASIGPPQHFNRHLAALDTITTTYAAPPFSTAYHQQIPGPTSGNGFHNGHAPEPWIPPPDSTAPAALSPPYTSSARPNMSPVTDPSGVFSPATGASSSPPSDDSASLPPPPPPPPRKEHYPVGAPEEFRCVCSRSFAGTRSVKNRKGNLRRHIDEQNGDVPPVLCTFRCGHTTVRPGNMRTHEKTCPLRTQAE